MERNAVYELGPYRLDRSARILWSGSSIVPLTPKAFELLLVLVEKPGQLVTKDELIKAVWPDTFVEESNLTSNISILRKILGTHPEGGEYIETLPKRGYRLVAAVRLAESAAEDELCAPQADEIRRRVSLRWAFGVAAGAAMVLLGGLYFAGALPWVPAWGAPRIEALAVLPLENLSGDPSQEFFADGMTEALTTNLAQIRTLRVISRTSVMQYKGTSKPLREIAKKLKVDAIVRGSVARFGQRVRVTAALIQASTDEHVWAMTYEKDLGDILDLQNEIVRAITDKIDATVTPQEQNRLARRRPVNPDAYEAYLRGRYFWNQYTEDALLKSIGYFKQAIQLDANYAAAYAGLSDAWMGLVYIGAATMEEARPKAFDAASKALQADNTLAEGHGAMVILNVLDWNWAAAESECRTALALNPNYAVALISHSNTLRYHGRTAENIAEAKLVLKLDPLSALANEGLADAYFSARQYDLAIEQYHKTLELVPDRPASLDNLGWAHVFQGKYDEGIAEIKKSGEDPDLSPELAYVYAMRGERPKAERILQRLLSLSKQTSIAAHHFALVYAGLDQRREALQWLEKAYREHSPLMPRLKVDRRFDRLRAEPAFRDLIRRVGLI
jgi:TolB-like protein/DNA-binding winged helix-turn-helix (wHTH) protein